MRNLIVCCLCLLVCCEVASATRRNCVPSTSAEFNDSGTVVLASSSKDLSNVVLKFCDGSSNYKFDNLNVGQSASFSKRGKELAGVWIKSGCNHSGDGPGYGEFHGRECDNECDDDDDSSDDDDDCNPTPTPTPTPEPTPTPTPPGCDGQCPTPTPTPPVDCLGTPNGTAVVDDCGVCDGDGTSCRECEETETTEQSFALDTNSLKQKILVVRATKVLKKKRKKKALRIRRKAEELYMDNWHLAWSLPSVVFTCNTSAGCVPVDNTEILEKYISNSEKLKKLGLKGLKLTKRLLKKNTKSLRKLRIQILNAHTRSLEIALEVPTKGLVCE